MGFQTHSDLRANPYRGVAEIEVEIRKNTKYWTGRLFFVLRKQNKMSKNEHESKVEMVISTVPKPVFTSVFWTFYSASVISIESNTG